MQDNTTTLRDGRKLGFAEYGKADGIPLLLFHGTPGCRIMKRLETAPWINENGLRIIIPDRPGYGLSDPDRKRTIMDWATDVEQLANHLGLARYHVAGGSGGGPYALACAIHSPERVLSVTLICSGGPPEVMPPSKEMNRGNRIVFFLARYAPLVLRGMFALQAKAMKKRLSQPEPDSRQARKLARVKAKQLAGLPEWDRRLLEGQGGENMRLILQEAFRQGGDGPYRDLLLVSRPWHLDLGRLTAPVFMWHGTADTNVPISTAREFSKLIPGCETHFIPDAGHQLLGSAEVRSQIVARLLASNAQ
ncbi:MAG: alpha/beta hydrolase [Rhodanobacteraceae bacterium]|nr:MAG: alpha/beta hydrolase [Rhodanobacteraceae bacterium]